MSGSFPSTAGFQTLDFTSNTNTRTSVSVSGKTQRLQTGSQYWSFSLKSPKKERADVMVDYAFLVTQNGQADTFTIVPPVVTDARGTASGGGRRGNGRRGGVTAQPINSRPAGGGSACRADERAGRADARGVRWHGPSTR